MQLKLKRNLHGITVIVRETYERQVFCPENGIRGFYFRDD